MRPRALSVAWRTGNQASRNFSWEASTSAVWLSPKMRYALYVVPSVNANSMSKRARSQSRDRRATVSAAMSTAWTWSRLPSGVWEILEKVPLSPEAPGGAASARARTAGRTSRVGRAGGVSGGGPRGRAGGGGRGIAGRCLRHRSGDRASSGVHLYSNSLREEYALLARMRYDQERCGESVTERGWFSGSMETQQSGANIR